MSQRRDGKQLGRSDLHVTNLNNRNRGLSGRGIIVLLVGLALVLLVFDQLIAISPAGRKKLSTDISVDSVIGATVEPLDSGTARAIGIAPDSKGLIVTSVATRGPAAKAGLRSGDVIEAVGATDVRSSADAAKAFEKQHGPVTVIVNRNGHYARARLFISPATEGAADSDPKG